VFLVSALSPREPMNWHSHSVIVSLWCAQPILESGVLLAMMRRKLHKQFPVFSVYLISQLLNFTIIFPLWLADKHKAFFIAYWLGAAVNAVISFKVIHEVFLDVFRPYHTLKDLGTLLFRWAGVVMLLVSVVVAFSNSYDQSPLLHALTTLQRSVRIVQLGLILFLVFFSRFLGVSRKQVSFGISLGFGLFAGVELLLFALHSGGFMRQGMLNLINLVCYGFSGLIWTAYLFSPQSVGVNMAVTHRLQTERWEEGLADLQHSIPSDSLIPMFEGMVERAFSRSSAVGSAEENFTVHRTAHLARAKTAAAGGAKARS
jgi:hypothetical protein